MVTSAPACVLRRLITYTAANAAANAATTITRNINLRLLAGDFGLAPLGLEEGTLGLFLALSIFRFRLTGTEGNLLSNGYQWEGSYTVFSRKGAKAQRKTQSWFVVLLCAFA